MKNSSYYIAPVGDWTHDLPHTVASNMVKVSHALNNSATEAVISNVGINVTSFFLCSIIVLFIFYITPSFNTLQSK